MFWIELYPDGYHTNVRISTATIKLLVEFEVEVNIEVSFLQELYDESFNED